MSLILDALRKSEHQRQRQAGPALVVVPESQATRRPAAWIVVLVALLAVNIVVLAVVLLSGRGDRETAPAASVAPPPAPAAAAPAPRSTTSTVPLPTQAPRSEVRPLATEAATQAPAPAAAPTPAPAPAQATPTPGQAVATPQAAASAPSLPPAPGPSRTQAGDDARLPRFADMVVRGEINVPHMHVDIHVYSAIPAERFVFINMRRYNEGQATQEGPRVERIARDGVVMDYQGQRFFLARD